MVILCQKNVFVVLETAYKLGTHSLVDVNVIKLYSRNGGSQCKQQSSKIIQTARGIFEIIISLLHQNMIRVSWKMIISDTRTHVKCNEIYVNTKKINK